MTNKGSIYALEMDHVYSRWKWNYCRENSIRGNPIRTSKVSGELET